MKNLTVGLFLLSSSLTLSTQFSFATDKLTHEYSEETINKSRTANYISDAEKAKLTSYVNTLSKSKESELKPTSVSANNSVSANYSDFTSKISHFNLSIDEQTGELKVSGLTPKECASDLKLTIQDYNSSRDTYGVSASIPASGCSDSAVQSCTRNSCVDVSKLSNILVPAQGSKNLALINGHVALKKSGSLEFQSEDLSFPEGDPAAITYTSLGISFIDQDDREKSAREEAALQELIHEAETCTSAEQGNEEAVLELQRLGATKEYLAELNKKIDEAKFSELDKRAASAKTFEEYQTIISEVNQFGIDHPEMASKAAEAQLHISLAINEMELDSEDAISTYSINAKKLKLIKKALGSAHKLKPKNETYYLALNAVSLDAAKNAAENSSDPFAYSLARNEAMKSAYNLSNYYSRQMRKGNASPELMAALNNYKAQLFTPPAAMPNMQALWRAGMSPLPPQSELDSKFLTNYNKSFEDKFNKNAQGLSVSQEFSFYMNQGSPLQTSSPWNTATTYRPGF